ncbi:MAG: hypothetical protein ACK58L_00305 [Planctomycetota bacterium]
MRSLLTQLKWHSRFHSLGLSITMYALAGCGGGDEATTSSAPAADSGAAASTSGETPSAMMTSGMESGESASMEAPSGAMAGGSMPPGGMPGGMPPGGMPGGDAAMSGGPGGEGGPLGGQFGSGMPGQMPGGMAQAKPPRSTDFSRWSDKDFHDAIRERDEIVLKAIDARVKAKPNDPAVATLLTALLMTSAEAPAAETMTGGFPGGDGAFSSGDGVGGMMSGQGGMPGSMPPNGGPPRKKLSGMLQGGVPGAAGAPAEQNSSNQQMEAPAGPSSSIRRSRAVPAGRAVDSLELMLLESLVAYQQPGVMAGRGAADSLSSGSAPGMHGADESSGLVGGNQSGGDDGAMLGAPSMGAQGAPGPAGMRSGSGMPGMPGGLQGMPGGMQGMSGAGTQNGRLDSRVLVRKILEHLVKNGSPVAWQTIFAVASGTTQTSMSPTEATQIVAESLLKNLEGGGPQVEQVLLAIVEGKAQLPPENRSVILATMAAVSSAAADQLTGFDNVSTVPAASQPGGIGAGMGMGMGMGAGRGMPGGLSGMMSGGRGNNDGSATGIEGAGDFGGPGMSAPGMDGGSLMAPPSGTVMVTDFNDSELARAAVFLWGPRHVNAMVDQLKVAADPVGAGELLKLAATIPNQKSREAVYSALSKIHSLGADSLRGAGVFSEVHDPGLLVVLKALPRPKASRTEAQTMDSWTMTSEEVVLALRDKMKALSAQPGKLTAVNDGFPVKLHRNAISEFSGVLTLPGTMGTNLKDAAPSDTKVYYARTSFTPQKPKDQDDIKEHYESRASGTVREDQGKQLLWIDGVKGGTSGVRRTMDVIIQASANRQGFGGADGGSGFGIPGGPAGAGGQAGGSSYTIEIIVVETADPKGSTTASAEAVPGKNEKK